jgi:Flp pilus assembly protein TadG
MRILHRVRVAQSGNAAVEFALAAPILMLLVAGLFDYGMVVRLSTQLNSAARAGVHYATIYPADTDGVRRAAQNSVNDSRMTVSTPVLFCTCGSSTATRLSTCDETSICSVGVTRRNYVSVRVQRSYTPLLPYRGFGAPITMNGSAVLQVP